MLVHEYVLLNGINRAQIGRYIGIASASISALVVFLLLSVVDVAEKFGVSVTIPPALMSLVGAGTVFTLLYWLFDRYIWRWPALHSFLKVPNLKGDWECEGSSLNSDGQVIHSWTATVSVTQSWDKLRVRLKSRQSGSNSIVAALSYDEADGYHLIYNYRNDPKIGETHLRSHLGFSDMTISPDQQTASGEYFNGHGRFTFGRMEWRRSNGS